MRLRENEGNQEIAHQTGIVSCMYMQVCVCVCVCVCVVCVCLCTTGCSEIGSLTSLDAPEFHASSNVREPISLHQAVFVCVCVCVCHNEKKCQTNGKHAAASTVQTKIQEG